MAFPLPVLFVVLVRVVRTKQRVYARYSFRFSTDNTMKIYSIFCMAFLAMLVFVTSIANGDGNASSADVTMPGKAVDNDHELPVLDVR